MNQLSVFVIIVLLCVSVPGFSYETRIQKGPRDGFFAVTFAEDDFPGVPLAELAVQVAGSDTFGLCGNTTRQETVSAGAQEKACFANIRILQAAVEMYNMDRPEMLKSFDSETMEKLVQGGYLRQPPTRPHPQCNYTNEGDLTGNGVIFCSLHGKIEALVDERKKRQETLREQLKTTPRFQVSGRCRNGGTIAFQVNDRRTGAMLKRIEIPHSVDRPTTQELSGAWLNVMSGKLKLLEALTAFDSCFSYLEKQLPRVLEKKRAAPYSGSRANRPSGFGQSSLYSLTTGALAIQESLQLDRMTGQSDSSGPADISIDRLKGPEIKSHPFKEMIGGKKPAVYPIDALVPETFYSCHFSDINRELAFSDFIDRWGSNILHSFQVSAHDSHLKEKLLGQLCLETSELTRLFGDKVIDDLTICGADPFLSEGSDFSILFSIKNRTLFEMNVSRYFTKAKAENPGCKEETLTVGDTAVHALTSPDRHVRSFSCDVGEYKVYSNSLTALTLILSAARKETPSLGNADDYRYMRTIFPADPTKEDGFLYLSDAHIRQLVGPVWKIERQRRIQCLNSLRIAQNAVTLFHLLNLPGTISLENLYKERVLEEAYMHCPDGGTYSWDASGGEAVCSIHGRLRFMTPILETRLAQVTKQEQEDYEHFVRDYNQYWRQYFDPIGIRAILSPGHLHAETCILPLVETSIYNGFKRLSGGAPVKIDLPDHPRAIMQFIGKLDFQNLATWDSQSEDLAANLVTGTNLTLEQLLQAIGQSFVLGLVDSSMKFQFAGGLLGDLMPGFTRDTTQMLMLSYLMASLNLPVYALIEVRDAALAEQFLRSWLTRLSVQNVMQENRSSFFATRFFEIASDKGQPPVFELDMLVLVIRWRIFFTIRDNCLIIASQRQLLEELAAKNAPRVKAETNLETRINYRAFKEIAETTSANWQEQIHSACLNNLGSLYALSSFRGLPPSDWSKASLLINGYIPFCPLGGTYSFNEAADAVQCSIHGSALHPRRPWNPDPNAPLNKLFDSLQGVSASLRFTPEGIMTSVDLNFAP